MALLNALLFAGLGMAVYVVALALLFGLTPGSLRHHILEGRNTALAVLLGAIAVGLAIIIASAVH